LKQRPHVRPLPLAVLLPSVLGVLGLATCTYDFEAPFAFSPSDGGASGVGGGGGAGGTTSSSSSGSTSTSSSGQGGTSTSTSSGTAGGGGAGGGGDCVPPAADCDGNPQNGCETHTDTHLEHCGGCNQPCATACVAGQCAGPCDGNLAIDESDPTIALQAIGLCSGVQSAAWVLPDGTAPSTQLTNYHLGHGILDDFGSNVNVQEGTQLLALSSGAARRPGDTGYQGTNGLNKNISCSHPQGFPKTSPSCGSQLGGGCHDGAAIEVTLTVPASANGFSFASKYYTGEWSQYVCSQFADVFLALLSPAPQGQQDGNVTFDSLGNTMGSHSELIDVCTCTPSPPCTGGGISFPCALGDAELSGTGFVDHAATGWLQTVVPATGGGSITLRFTVYDSGDGVIDSLVLIDRWRWVTSAGGTPTTTVIANPR